MLCHYCFNKGVEIFLGFNLIHLYRHDVKSRPVKPAMDHLAAIDADSLTREHSLHTLQDRALVEVVERGEGIGRPLLYGTTQRFLEHFGFKALEDLPRPEELPVILRDRTPLEDLVEESEGAPDEAPATEPEDTAEEMEDTAEEPSEPEVKDG